MSHSRLLRSLAVLFLIAFAALIAPSAYSQVAIYRFDFEKEGPSINYGFYEEAWVVADATGGPASWLLTFREGPHRRYISIDEFGSLFFPNKGGTVVGVISAAAATGTPQTTFLAVGEVETEIRGANVKVKVPKQMKGYALSADDASSAPFDDDEGNSGYAGISKMDGDLEQSRSKDASSRNLTVAETFAELIDYLERRGYSAFEVEALTDDEEVSASNTNGSSGTAFSLSEFIGLESGTGSVQTNGSENTSGTGAVVYARQETLDTSR